VTGLQFHNAVSAAGVNDGFDLGDWVFTPGDAFGAIAPGRVGTVSATDLRVLDVLGWRPASAGPFVPAPDDFANSLADASHAPGQVAVGGSASGALQAAGDHDLFAVQLQAGVTYAISLTGHAGGAGTLADPALQLRDAAGAVLAANDDAVDGVNPDSRILFTPGQSATYYADAGASLEGYAGTYRLGVSADGQTITGAQGGDTLQAPDTNDTLVGGSGGANYLRGNGGDDSISGGSGFDDSNGNMGNDTIHGNGGDDFSVGGKDNDLLFGDDGADIVWGNLGNDTCDGGAGDDQCRGGQGDDSVTGGAGNDFISGDRGNDTVAGGAGADIFHTSQDAGIDRVLDFHLAEGDRVQLDPGTTFTLSQVGANTVIDLGAGNQMILVGVQMATLTPGWIFGA